MTNREIAQEISNRIGTAPVPFDSVYSIALQIYNELGGEQTQFDSVYSILLEILPLVEGGIKPIEEVSELPEASENKDKFYRLDNGEKDVYTAKLLSSETITTNRLPDEQQIDKAYLFYANYDCAYYKGSYKIICSDGEIDGYGWIGNNGSNDYISITLNNTVDISNNSVLYGRLSFYVWNIDEVAKTITNLSYTISDLNDDYKSTIEDDGITPIPAIYNAPESAQIGNAYISDGDYYYYTGREITLVVSDGEFKGYGWEYEGDGYCTYLTNKIASDIYYNDVNSDVGVLDIFRIDTFENWTISGDTYTNLSMSLNDCVYGNIVDIGSIYIPQLNAPDSEQVDIATISMTTLYHGNHTYYYKGEIQIRTYDFETTSSDYVTAYLWHTDEQVGYSWDSDYITLNNANNTYKIQIPGVFPNEDLQNYGDEIGWATTTLSLSQIPDYLSYYDSQEITSQTSNIVKYQRTETTEEWDWEKIATEAYVDDAIAEISKVIHTTATGELNPVNGKVTISTIDYTPLNNINTAGKYDVIIDGTMTVQGMQIPIQFSATLEVSAIMNDFIKLLFIKCMDGYKVAVSIENNEWNIAEANYIQIDDSVANINRVYSSSKVEELIASLEARIAALEGN